MAAVDFSSMTFPVFSTPDDSTKRHLGFLVCSRAMFGTAGHDDKLAGPSSTILSLNLTRKRPRQTRNISSTGFVTATSVGLKRDSADRVSCRCNCV
jgi:hypothetical protein